MLHTERSNVVFLLFCFFFLGGGVILGTNNKGFLSNGGPFMYIKHTYVLCTNIL